MKVGLVGWRGMVGSVLMARMQAERDFDLFDAVFFSTSKPGAAAPRVARGAPTLLDGADVTDAMILHRLLAALFENRVSIVTTSNFKPDDLYPNGLHRDRILPAIELLKERLVVVLGEPGSGKSCEFRWRCASIQTRLSDVLQES